MMQLFKKYPKKSQMSHEMLFMIFEFLSFVFILIILVSFVHDVEDSTIFEKNFLARDIAMTINTVYASPQSLTFRYRENTTDFVVKIADHKVSVKDSNEEPDEIAKVYWFADQSDMLLSFDEPFEYIENLQPESKVMYFVDDLIIVANGGSPILEDYEEQFEDDCSIIPDYEVECMSNPNKDSFETQKNCVVIHYSEGNNPDSTHNGLIISGKSAHYILGRDCRIIQEVPDKEVAWHADCSLGCSDNTCCKPDCPVCEQDGDFVDPNTRCIGIEVDNFGYLCDEPGYGDVQGVECILGWEVYTEKQNACLVDLVDYITKKHNIPVDRDHIVGHQEITIGEPDPGPAFDWDFLMEQLQIRRSDESI